MAHIISINPVKNDTNGVKKEYISRLKKYLRIGGWNRRKYESSLIEAYEKILNNTDKVIQEHEIDYYRNFIVFDLLHIMGNEVGDKSKEKLKQVEKQYLIDFSNVTKETNLFFKIINSVQKSDKSIIALQKKLNSDEEILYLKRVRENLIFKSKRPYGIMVTATMSAGKSTFINSLIGKYVCLSQNMACTSKIHSIINKPFEDGFSYEYDHDLVMTAGKEELLNDNELNTSDKIIVATHFCGNLSEERIVMNDSPGVNFSGDIEHKTITDKLIKGRKYDLLIYVMNSTQLATNDEDEHLEFVKQTIGRKPIIFVLNKIDAYNTEEENVFDTIQRQREYLIKKGFKNPIVCPLSARAGYLSKQFCTGLLTRSEERELYNYVDKFEQMQLTKYYDDNFPKVRVFNREREEEQLLKTCGLAYVEQIIREYVRGGK